MCSSDLEALHLVKSEIGADIAALASHALAEILERARLARLTRHQHVLLRFGELIAWVEAAAGLARRAARAAEDSLNEKHDRRFKPGELAVMARVFARQAALKVASEGVELVVGSNGVQEGGLAELESAAKMPQIRERMRGLLEDMDEVSRIVYERV